MNKKIKLSIVFLTALAVFLPIKSDMVMANALYEDIPFTPPDYSINTYNRGGAYGLYLFSASSSSYTELVFSLTGSRYVFNSDNVDFPNKEHIRFTLSLASTTPNFSSIGGGLYKYLPSSNYYNLLYFSSMMMFSVINKSGDYQYYLQFGFSNTYDFESLYLKYGVDTSLLDFPDLPSVSVPFPNGIDGTVYPKGPDKFYFSLNVFRDGIGTIGGDDLGLSEESFNLGRDVGFNEGYEKGHTDGYSQGYGVGSSDNIDWFQAIRVNLASAFSLFNVEIFPNLTLGMLAFIPLFFGLLAFLFSLGGRKK